MGLWDEMGADFAFSRADEIFHDMEYVGVIAKIGKIVQDDSAVERQIKECESSGSLAMAAKNISQRGWVLQQTRSILDFMFLLRCCSSPWATSSFVNNITHAPPSLPSQDLAWPRLAPPPHRNNGGAGRAASTPGGGHQHQLGRYFLVVAGAVVGDQGV